MSITKKTPEIDNLIQQRIQANTWSLEGLARFIQHHLDGEFDDDGITQQTANINHKLSEAFARHASDITQDDMNEQLSKVFSDNRDWLPHLDIAMAMAKAQPSALTLDNIYRLREMSNEGGTQNGTPETNAFARQQNAKRFLQALAL
jgi:hypothetical protein